MSAGGGRYRVVLLDLDGTLLNSKRGIRAENVRALRQLMQAGVRVAFCTGRSPRSVKTYVDALGVNAPCIHFNGAVVFDHKDARAVYARALAHDTALAALAAADGRALHANVYVGDDIWIERVSATSQESELKDGVPHTLVPDLRSRLGPRAFATKIMLIAQPARIAALTSVVASAVGEHAALVNSEPAYLEVLPPRCSKKSAADALAAHLGVALSDVIAFGDNLNDLELLLACGWGVAMANSHADVLARVKTHVGDNDSDGIARFFDAFDVVGGVLHRRA